MSKEQLPEFPYPYVFRLDYRKYLNATNNDIRYIVWLNDNISKEQPLSNWSGEEFIYKEDEIVAYAAGKDWMICFQKKLSNGYNESNDFIGFKNEIDASRFALEFL